jgi:hypothetical protein
MRSTLLLEAKQHMTPKEKQLHKKLIRLLLDDGKGHHHKKYAMRLRDFNIKIVSLKADPNFTAGIVFDTGMIYISEGFLLDESLFYQLNVLMRHELAHNLLMHQIRMMGYLGSDFADKWGVSQSLHDILNIIEDLEISDRIYNQEDMDTVRNMYLNGRVIGGLLTEDQRPEWVDMPLETMYDKLVKEIEAIHAQITKGIQSAISHHNKPYDRITDTVKGTMAMYGDTDMSSAIDVLLDDMAADNFKLHGKALAPEFHNIIKTIYTSLKADTVDDAGVDTLLAQIKSSSPIKSMDLVHPLTGKVILKLHTPEQKSFAVEVIKKFRSEEEDWYRTVMVVLTQLQYDATTIKEIWDKTRGTANGN